MAWRLTHNSRCNLLGVHGDLVRVVELVAQRSPVELLVVEGLRSISTQKEMVRIGACLNMRSRFLTGHAVRLCARVDGIPVWGLDVMSQVAEVVKTSAGELEVPVEWLWDQNGLDAEQFQLPWDEYPNA